MSRQSLPPEPPESLTQAVQWALRPIIRLLLRWNITLPTLVKWIKALYVEIAERDFKLPDKAQTDSRISLLTGVHRKDVKQYRNQTNTSTPPTSRTAQMIAMWTSTAPFFDERQQQPQPLPIQSEADGSFPDLVRRVNKQDIRPRAVLDQWVDAGVVTVEDGCAHLLPESLTRSPQQDDKALFFGKIIHDHIEASATNLVSEDAPHLDRCVYYNNLSPESVQALRELAETESMKLLERLNREARRMQQQDHSNAAKHRFTYGAFFYQTKQFDDHDQ